MKSPTAKPPTEVELRHAFALAIVETRLSRQYSQEDLAEFSGLSVSYISMLENGRRNLTMKAASQLSSAFQLPLSGLVNLAELKLKRSLRASD